MRCPRARQVSTARLSAISRRSICCLWEISRPRARRHRSQTMSGASRRRIRMWASFGLASAVLSLHSSLGQRFRRTSLLTAYIPPSQPSSRSAQPSSAEASSRMLLAPSHPASAPRSRFEACATLCPRASQVRRALCARRSWASPHSDHLSSRLQSSLQAITRSPSSLAPTAECSSHRLGFFQSTRRSRVIFRTVPRALNPSNT